MIQEGEGGDRKGRGGDTGRGGEVIQEGEGGDTRRGGEGR